MHPKDTQRIRDIITRYIKQSFKVLQIPSPKEAKQKERNKSVRNQKKRSGIDYPYNIQKLNYHITMDSGASTELPKENQTCQ